MDCGLLRSGPFLLAQLLTIYQQQVLGDSTACIFEHPKGCKSWSIGLGKSG